MQTALATPTAMLTRVREVQAGIRAGEVELIQLVTSWADAHPDLDEPTRDGVPAVAWDAGAPLAAALGLSTQAGEALTRDALEMRHRLPRLWRAVLDGSVPVWRARRIAAAVSGHPADVAAWLDDAVAPVAHRVGPVVLDRLIDEAMLRLYPEEREQAQLEALDRRHVTLHETSLNDHGIGEMTMRGDWKDLKDFDDVLSEIAALLDDDDEQAWSAEPLDVRRSRAVGVLADPAAALALLEGRSATRPRRRTTLVVHVSAEAVAGLDPVARCETLNRAVLEQQVRDWCGRTDTHLTVTPVVDLADHSQTGAYEIGDRLRTRVDLVAGSCVFPWCTRPARLCDHDHVVPHGAGGATCDCNLAPLCRRHHRLKTHAGWRYTTVETGVWLWSDPHGQQFLRDATGTIDVTSQHHDRSGWSGCLARPPDEHPVTSRKQTGYGQETAPT